jgi:glyoxylase I family protein
LPGHGDNGPTLEIFQYSQQVQTARPSVIKPGFAHIAFAVKDVVAAQSEVLRNGGSTVGEVTTVMTSDQRRVKWCYVRDPEGNIIELQTWE